MVLHIHPDGMPWWHSSISVAGWMIAALTVTAHGIHRLHCRRKRRQVHVHCERVLAEERRLEDAIFATTDDIVMVIDRGGVVVRFNHAAELLSGYGFDEVRSQPFFWLRFLPAEQHDWLRKRFNAFLRGEETPPFVMDWAGRLGGRRTVSWRISLFREIAVGTPSLLVAVGQDVTERRRAELAVRENEIKFHTMVDWTSDWEYWVQPDSGFVYMTPSVERVTGYRAEEFYTDPGLVRRIIHAQDLPQWEKHAQDVRQSDGDLRIEELEIRIVHKAGHTLWVSHRCRPVVDDAGIYRGRRVTVRDITARKLAEDEIRQLAYFDVLTGLPNRRLLIDRLAQAQSASHRNDEFAVLMMLDLDHFKTLNDSAGHDAGDRLLVGVAQRLQTCVRQDDTVSRLGGDEFVVLLQHLGQQADVAATRAEAVAEKIRLALGNPFSIGGGYTEYTTSASIGLSLFRGRQFSVETLFKQADMALYQAKDAGRNTARFFDPQMQAAIDSRTGMERELRAALELRQFEVHYQPQVDQFGRLVGAEALLRWQSPERGTLCPGQFIGLAEDSGLIVVIGEWVLRQACEQLRQWSANGLTRQLRLAVNISVRQFHHPEFADRLLALLQELEVDRALLKLELTEQVILHDTKAAIRRMWMLHDQGVHFSLDDFGTGYSSLSLLKRLPFEQIKIDRSFVQDIGQDAHGDEVVRAMLAVGRFLKLEVVAEGVEHELQQEFLSMGGCAVYQGFLFGEPVPIHRWDSTLFRF